MLLCLRRVRQRRCRCSARSARGVLAQGVEGGAAKPFAARATVRHASHATTASSKRPVPRSRSASAGRPAQVPKVRRLVWEFLCQVVFWFVAGSLFGAERPFLVPSLTIRFADEIRCYRGPIPVVTSTAQSPSELLR